MCPYCGETQIVAVKEGHNAYACGYFDLPFTNGECKHYKRKMLIGFSNYEFLSEIKHIDEIGIVLNCKESFGDHPYKKESAWKFKQFFKIEGEPKIGSKALFRYVCKPQDQYYLFILKDEK